MVADPRNVLRPVPLGSLNDFRAATGAPLLAIEGAPVAYVAALSIPTSTHAIDARLYRPTTADDLPAIVFFHGGGFVLCSVDTHDAMCRDLALRSGAVVVSVDYRCAPKTPFPGPLEDCHAALAWVAANATTLGVNPERIAVCGDSAGGNLAIATALLARERGPALRYIGIIYPMIDPACGFPSIGIQSDGPVLSREILDWFWDNYLGAGRANASPFAAVLTANLSGLPPATVLTAEYDPLCDEGEAFAGALRAAGNATVSRRYLGMAHGFLSMPALSPIAGHAMADLGNDFRAAFAT